MIRNDFPGFNFDLGETADMLRDTVRSYSQDRIAPLCRKDRPRGLVSARALAGNGCELGLHGITVEEEWGGSGSWVS